MRELRQKHSELQDPQTITRINQEALASEFDGDLEAIHKHEVHEIIDDFDRGERILKIRKRKIFI